MDARIISNVKGSWHVEQGPITDFDKACQGKWTLLVQGVDKYVPDVTPPMVQALVLTSTNMMYF